MVFSEIARRLTLLLHLDQNEIVTVKRNLMFTCLTLRSEKRIIKRLASEHTGPLTSYS